tara:strand:+ start:458 stop:1276 length:819 start_codon:yes stop_codon:yes gene_type:complete
MEFANKLMERTGKGYLSYSALKYAADGSPDQDMKMFEMYMTGELKKTSGALQFGGLYDTLLLEPETLTDKYHVIFDDDKIVELSDQYKNPRASKVYKEWFASELEHAGNKSIVNEDMMRQAETMIKRLNETEILDMETGLVMPARHYLKGQTQYEIMDWIGDIPVRGFLDVRGHNFISDSKTTAKSVHNFRYDINKYNYDIQAYIYCEVEQQDDFYWVVQSKLDPYLTGVYKASKLTLSKGETKFWSAIQNIRHWLDSPTKGTYSFGVYGEI